MAQTRALAIGAAAVAAGALYYANSSGPAPHSGSNHAKAGTGGKSNGSALPVHTGATGSSSAKDAAGTSDNMSGKSTSGKEKFEAGVAATRTGENAVGRRGGESLSG